MTERKLSKIRNTGFPRSVAPVAAVAAARRIAAATADRQEGTDISAQTEGSRTVHLNKPGQLRQLARRIRRDNQLLLILVPVLAYYIIFKYVPMYGLLMAFKDFQPFQGILGSPWADMSGWYHFQRFFDSVYFGRLIRNTVLLSLYTLLWSFPVPIIFALLLNEVKEGLFKKAVQTVSYLPYFISVVVIVGMIKSFTAPLDGIVNVAISHLGFAPINFLAEPEWFRSIYISSTIWQTFGYGSIIYLAAIAGVNPQLYEAAEVDGATRWQKVWSITLPSILPVIITLFILNLGSLMVIGFEKVWLLYNPLTYETADVIDTFVYRQGIVQADYSYAAAISLFKNVIDITLLIAANYVSRKVTETSLW